MAFLSIGAREKAFSINQNAKTTYNPVYCLIIIHHLTRFSLKK